MEYFYQQEAEGQPLTISGLAVALDTSRETLMDYQNKDTFTDTVKRLKGICEAYAEKHMFVGKNPAGAIFALKNYGWRDQQQIEQFGEVTHKYEDMDDEQLERALQARKDRTTPPA